MEITIFNGVSAGAEHAFDDKLNRLRESLQARKHNVEILQLREMDLKKCIGCFGCWVKTPGSCVIRDDRDALCTAMVQRDLVVHASPLKMGFVSPLVRMASERVIPVVMPYAEIKDGEIRHTLRYERYARLGLLYEEEADTDEEDLEIVRSIYEQIAAEFHRSLSLFSSIDSDIEEICDALDSI